MAIASTIVSTSTSSIVSNLNQSRDPVVREPFDLVRVVGTHDRDNRMPIPDHISARPDDLQSLVDGMIAFDHSAEEKLDAVIAATVLAFGSVYIHPFEDGNGRSSQVSDPPCSWHGAASTPPGIHFPVSAGFLTGSIVIAKRSKANSRRLTCL